MEERTDQSIVTEDMDQKSSEDQMVKDDTAFATENGSASENDEDNLPDLIWPDKPSKTGSANISSDLTSSASNDTGFESGSASEVPSPGETDKAVEESLNNNGTGSETEGGKTGGKGNAEEDKPEGKEDAEEDEELDILGNGLLKKKILIPGKGVDTRPGNGDTVTLKVDGQLEDGTHVDTGEVTFILNDGDVILAFDLAVALMEVGEKCQLSTSARYAYGSQGRDPDIPKDASITYTLELVSVQSAPELSSMSYDERLKLGEAKRERGNHLFGRSDFTGAINSYSKAVKLLDNSDLNVGLDEASRSLLTESWVKCYNNMAACQLKIDALDAAIRSCEKVLSAQENNVKALFRLGKAHGAKGDIDLALTYLRRAIKQDPESKIMHQEVLRLTRQKSKETASEKELYQRMLGVKPGENPFLAGRKKKKQSSNGLLKWTLLAGGVAAVLVSVGLTWYRVS